MKKTFLIILCVGIIVGVGGYFLVKQAYAATPADPLFTLQTIADDIQRAVTTDDVALTELEQKILVRRQEQVEEMIERDDITGEQLEEGLQLMAQQRTRVLERLQIVEQQLVQNQANEKAIEAIQNVQMKYEENLDRQLETIGKAQDKYNGIGESVKESTVKEATNRGRVVPQNIGTDVETEEGNPPVEMNAPRGR